MQQRERNRQTLLDRYQIVENSSEQIFDNLTLIASQICDSSIALISFIDNDRQWFKSAHGTSLKETLRDNLFCERAINEPTKIFEVENAKEDQIISTNPLVNSELDICFYAGVPLVDGFGQTLGILSVIDQKPKKLTVKQKRALKAVASELMDKLTAKKVSIKPKSNTGEDKELEMLKRNNFLYHSLIESAPLGIIISDMTDKRFISNSAFEEMIGYSKEELFALSATELSHPDDIEETRRNIKKLQSGKVTRFTMEKRYIRRDGEIVWGMVSSGFVPGEDNKPAYFITTIENITEQKKLYEENIAVKNRLELALDGTRDGIIDWLNIKLDKQWWSSRFYEMIGLNPDTVEASARYFLDNLLHPEDFNLVYTKALECIHQNIPFEVEFRLKTKNKGFKWFKGKGNVTERIDGKALRMTGSISEIDKSKKLEIKLKETKAFLSKVNSIVPSIIFIFNHEKKHYEYSNNYLIKLLGYTKDEINLFGNSLLSEICHPKDLQLLLDNSKAVEKLTDGDSIILEFRGKHKNGSYKWLQSTHSVFERDSNNNVTKHIGIVVDITKIKEVQDQLADSTNFLKKITNISPNVISIFNFNTMSVEYINEGVGSLLGYSAEELIAMGEDYLSTICHSDDLNNLFEYFKSVSNLKDGETLNHEYRMKHKDGEYRWVLSRDTIFDRSKEGKTIKKISVLTDITNLKKVQKKLSNQARKLKQQNNDLKQFNYVATHDLKNPLITLNSYFDLLKKELTNSSPKISSALEFMEEEFDNFKLTQTGLTDAIRIREDKVIVEQVDLNKAIKQLVSSHQKKIESQGGQILTNLDTESIVKSSQVYIKSILDNLISNAIKYKSEKRPPIIKISSKKTKRKLHLYIEDNGLGIDLELQKNKLFGMFNRFHHHSEGSGMGLYMVKSMVEKLGGKIAIESEVDKGTKFDIQLLLA